MTLQVKNEAAIVGPISLCRVFLMYLVTRHVFPTPTIKYQRKKRKEIYYLFNNNFYEVNLVKQ